MSETTQEPASELSASDILSKYRPDNKAIEVPLPDGEVFTFSPITSKKDRDKLASQAAKFCESLPKPTDPGFKQHPLADVIPEDIEDAFTAYKISARSIAPKIDHRTALELQYAPEVLDHILKHLGLADKRLYDLAQKRLLDEAKKKSMTSGTESDSQPA